MSWARAGWPASDALTRAAATAAALQYRDMVPPSPTFVAGAKQRMNARTFGCRNGGEEGLELRAAVLLAFLADALDRHHALVVGRVEHDHALGRAPGDTDAFDAGADELSAVGDQHQLVAVLDRERGDQLAGLLPDCAVTLAHVHRHDAFAAAAGDPIFVGRGPLAVSALRDREHELLGRRHFHVTLLAELDRTGNPGLRRVLGIGRRFLGVAVEAAPHGVGALEIGHALVRARVHMPQDRQRDHPVALGQRDAAHAHGGAALEYAHVGDGEANALAVRGREQHVVALGTDLHV